jgi:broad specificity phosphatase PhoE
MKAVELRRHTASEGDRLTPEGVAAAIEIGSGLVGPYDRLISSGAQRATQTLACFLAGSGQRSPGGVTVDETFRSSAEERWFTAARQTGARDIGAFQVADKALVEEEAKRFGNALRQVFDSLGEGGRALIVGHSPMHEAAVYGLTGQVIAPIPKGGGVRIIQDGRGFRVEPLN